MTSSLSPSSPSPVRIGRRELFAFVERHARVRLRSYADLVDGRVLCRLFSCVYSRHAITVDDDDSDKSNDDVYTRRRRTRRRWCALRRACVRVCLPLSLLDASALARHDAARGYATLVLFYFLRHLCTRLDYTVVFAEAVCDDVTSFLQSTDSLASLLCGGALHWSDVPTTLHATLRTRLAALHARNKVQVASAQQYDAQQDGDDDAGHSSGDDNNNDDDDDGSVHVLLLSDNDDDDDDDDTAVSNNNSCSSSGSNSDGGTTATQPHTTAAASMRPATITTKRTVASATPTDTAKDTTATTTVTVQQAVRQAVSALRANVCEADTGAPLQVHARADALHRLLLTLSTMTPWQDDNSNSDGGAAVAARRRRRLCTEAASHVWAMLTAYHALETRLSTATHILDAICATADTNSNSSVAIDDDADDDELATLRAQLCGALQQHVTQREHRWRALCTSLYEADRLSCALLERAYNNDDNDNDDNDDDDALLQQQRDVCYATMEQLTNALMQHDDDDDDDDVCAGVHAQLIRLLHERNALRNEVAMLRRCCAADKQQLHDDNAALAQCIAQYTAAQRTYEAHEVCSYAHAFASTTCHTTTAAANDTRMIVDTKKGIGNSVLARHMSAHGKDSDVDTASCTRHTSNNNNNNSNSNNNSSSSNNSSNSNSKHRRTRRGIAVRGSRRGIRVIDFASVFGSTYDVHLLRLVTLCDLSHNDLTSTSPLHVLPCLHTLILAHNKLRRLAGLPTAVVRLDVSHNELEELADVAALTRLRTLDVCDNGMRSLHGLGAAHTALRVLRADGNALSCVDELAHVTRLRELTLTRNRLARAEALLFVRALSSLTVLHIADNAVAKVCGVPTMLARLQPSIVVLDGVPLLSACDVCHDSRSSGDGTAACDDDDNTRNVTTAQDNNNNNDGDNGDDNDDDTTLLLSPHSTPRAERCAPQPTAALPLATTHDKDVQSGSSTQQQQQQQQQHNGTTLTSTPSSCVAAADTLTATVPPLVLSQGSYAQQFLQQQQQQQRDARVLRSPPGSGGGVAAAAAAMSVSTATTATTSSSTTAHMQQQQQSEQQPPSPQQSSSHVTAAMLYDSLAAKAQLARDNARLQARLQRADADLRELRRVVSAQLRELTVTRQQRDALQSSVDEANAKLQRQRQLARAADARHAAELTRCRAEAERQRVRVEAELRDARLQLRKGAATSAPASVPVVAPASAVTAASPPPPPPPPPHSPYVPALPATPHPPPAVEEDDNEDDDEDGTSAAVVHHSVHDLLAACLAASQGGVARTHNSHHTTATANDSGSSADDDSVTDEGDDSDDVEAS